MFDDVGNKIKNVASVICWLGIISSCLIGIILISNGVELNNSYYTKGSGTALIVSGIILMVAGSIVSWIGSIMVYGFGELVANSKESREKLSRMEDKLGKVEEKLGKMEEKRPVIPSQQAPTTAAGMSSQETVDSHKTVNYNLDVSSYDQLLEYLEQFENARKMQEALEQNHAGMDEDLYEKLCEELNRIWYADRSYRLGKEYTMKEIKKFLAQYANQG